MNVKDMREIVTVLEKTIDIQDEMVGRELKDAFLITNQTIYASTLNNGVFLLDQWLTGTASERIDAEDMATYIQRANTTTPARVLLSDGYTLLGLESPIKLYFDPNATREMRRIVLKKWKRLKKS